MKALGGRTPRQAGRDSEGRVLRADLLKDYERLQARIPAGQGITGIMNVPAIVWMREALGQPIPEELAVSEFTLD